MIMLRTIYLFALFALTLWVATATTLLFADEAEQVEFPLIACESEKVVVVVDQGECGDYDGPTLGPTLGPGTCLGPACTPICDDPLSWVPAGQRVMIRLQIGAE